MRLKRHRLNVTFIEAPSIGAKFSSLTKPFTPRWDSPRNLNKDFLLSSQKPWERKKKKICFCNKFRKIKADKEH